jgi:hypothetical protein
MTVGWHRPSVRGSRGFQALGSPVSLDYREKASFKFNGVIEQVHVKYI